MNTFCFQASGGSAPVENSNSKYPGYCKSKRSQTDEGIEALALEDAKGPGSSAHPVKQYPEHASRESYSRAKRSAKAKVTSEADGFGSGFEATKLRNRKKPAAVLSARGTAASDPDSLAAENEGDGESHTAQKLPRASLTYKLCKKEAQEAQEQQSEVPKAGVLRDALEAFKSDSKVKDKALALYVSSEVKSLLSVA